jgi:carboxypeptidase T
MPRYRISITHPNTEAMADLVRKYKLHVIEHSHRHDKETDHHHVDAIAQPDEIRLLEANGYRVERHEDVDEIGKARQKEVGKGNRYKETGVT